MKLISAASTLWFALMAGFFFAFSSTVMPGLSLSAPDPGMIAMQEINIAVRNAMFAAGFWVALALAAAGALLSPIRRQPGWPFLFLGCLVYLAGVFAVTAAANVPMNRELATMPAGLAESMAYWSRYQTDWTLFNHVRMAAAFLAAAIVMIPLALSSSVN
ncbi:anthrone oxygenase family protein [Roseibium sp. Sym1]|uniref:anthrone oxygenase family protein n=1 Tax=Roseibium sp. Sym1 TaxID=3016006 RepID=UPI0022B3FB72|nr:anthrone oxygenase family protein [Roseibium sp. Sym1]